MRRNLSFYLVTLLLCGAGIYFVLNYGSQWSIGAAEHAASVKAIGGTTLLASLKHPLAVLLVQLIVILAVARVLGTLARRLLQPAVSGEILAGILLGPSLLGLLWPQTQGFLFPSESLATLKLLSQIGVILFMFVLGMELDIKQLRHKAGAAVLVSHASIVVPFFLGVVAALFVYQEFAPASVSFTPFALFMGVAMSITAFPVLGRILEDRDMVGSPLGVIALACAAVDDITAWCMLALVVALVKAEGLSHALVTLIMALTFVGVMIWAVRPQIARVARVDLTAPLHAKSLMAGVLVFVFGAALATEIIGIHALFGAFVAGLVMPHSAQLRDFLRLRLETVTAVFLLPLFFAYTGLRTQIDLLNDVTSWLWCLGLIVVAIVGKVGGSMLAARWAGMSWRDAAALGVLMNTRGLVELIVLNIGYDLGILSPRIFTMLVLMALITTFMTGPLLTLLGVGRPAQAAQMKT